MSCRWLVFALLPAPLALLPACGGEDGSSGSDNGTGTGPTEPDPPVVTSVEVTPNVATLASPGESVQLDATARDQNDKLIPDAQFTWGSSDEDVAVVDAGGLVTAEANGAAAIAATSGSVQGTANVVVTTSMAYVTHRFSDPDTHTNPVSVIEVASNTVVETFQVSDLAGEPAITPEGAFAYVTGSGVVHPVDLATDSVDGLIELGGGRYPSHAAVTPEGAFVYVVIPDTGEVGVISTFTNEVVEFIDVGPDPFAVAITPF